ncbi:acyl-CoA dehydrogenase [Stenotrophomonas sp. HMWF003]|uniref:acyl-CoA dehydrogenase n=1 Tax=Stenotrophomonas sp. HMWF003 TaxID=2056840 RepID=UPI000D4A9699|nr:acyl-CoA dehydrogenase [Stenotrophomonas sp. HMWF003]PTT59715.1 acyl-CoA dehydrogenase [Stenotrophomonas sp. HMWF003]
MERVIPTAESPALIQQAREWLASHPALPPPGAGDTLERWRHLAHLGARDLCLAKVLEAHHDAEAILQELQAPPLAAGQLAAVWAAEGPAATLAFDARRSTLSGTKPWCSGAGWVDTALVTVRTDGQCRLYRADLRGARIQCDVQDWQATGMGRIPSATAHLDQVPAVEVGTADAYLQRPGFWHGGAGIAACWYGAAAALAEPLRCSAKAAEPGVAAGLLGQVDMTLSACAALLRELATLIDADPARAHMTDVVRVRSVVERGCVQTLDLVARALGPGPMCMDQAHARRWSDLTVFIRQSHADRDWQQLGMDCHREGQGWTL